MKTKLINILDSYAKSRHSNELNLLLTINNYLMLDDTIITKIDNIDNYIRVSLKYDYNRLGINFYDNGDLGISLPFSGLFMIKGDDSNMSYDEIRELLINLH